MGENESVENLIRYLSLIVSQFIFEFCRPLSTHSTEQVSDGFNFYESLIQLVKNIFWMCRELIMQKLFVKARQTFWKRSEDNFFNTVTRINNLPIVSAKQSF